MTRIDWGHVAAQLQQQAGKLFMFLIFVGTAVAGHTDNLPAALQPYEQWFEALSWIASLVTAYAMRPIEPSPPPHNRRLIDRLPQERFR